MRKKSNEWELLVFKKLDLVSFMNLLRLLEPEAFFLMHNTSKALSGEDEMTVRHHAS